MTERFLPLLSLGVAIAIFFLYVNPTWSGSIQATKAAIALDDQALTAANRYAAQQNQLASARNAIDPADLERLSAFLPDSVNNVGIILDLNALAARAGLSLENIDVASNDSDDSVGPTNPLGSADLTLSALGTYGALQNFLRSVERSRRLLDVQSFSVKGSDTGVYTYQMSIRLYWLR